MDVSIIIINYNTLNVTNNCIQSVLSKTKLIDYEIILVDNASTDGSKEFFENRSDIKYIYSDTNLGFGKANNLGVQHSRGRNLLFLNSDTILLNNAVKILSDCLDSHQEIGVVGGNLYNVKGDPTISYERTFPSIVQSINRYLLNIPFRIIYKKNLYHNFTNRNLTVAYISGADLMIRKSLFDEFGGFSPKYFMYYEETDLCFRINKKGYLIYSCPKAKIIHLEGASIPNKPKEFNYRKAELMYISRKIFIKNNHTQFYYLIDYSLQRLLLYILFFIKSKRDHYRRLLELQK